jgi:hypothetical protein
MLTAWPELWPSPWPGGALDQLLAVGNAGLLVCLRDAVDVAAERDDGWARAPARYPGGRHAGNAALDGEAVLLQHVSEVVRGLELLVCQLAEAEHGVVHHLRKLAPRFHAFDHARLELFEPGDVGGPLLCHRGATREKKRGEREPPKRAGFPSLHADHRALPHYGDFYDTVGRSAGVST